MSATSSSAPDGSEVFSTESQSGTVIIVSAVLTGLSTVVVLLRLYTRQFILKTAGADDWTCLFGAIFSYNFGMNVIKVSFLLQYRRIFPSHALKVVCLCGLVFVGIWTVIQGVLLSITCIPLATIQPSTASWCLNTLTIWEFTSAVGLITDFAIFLLPMPSIWKLPIQPRQRIVLLAIFGLGFFVCIVSIIRLPTLRAASMATDPTWNNVSAALWTLTELNVAILCSSLPVLRPLVFKSSGRGRKKTITGDAAKNASKQTSRGDALELTTTSRRKTMRTVISGANESLDELVHSTIDEMIYRSGEPESRAGAGYNTAVLTDDNAAELGQGQQVKTWIYSEKRDG
ncbi:integral membrane protein [Diaporthe eres]|nr:integral membrane protein [Diaporthe eres]